MDDRNGECFGHHEDLYFEGSINTSVSELECLKHLLEKKIKNSQWRRDYFPHPSRPALGPTQPPI
jgi:hypothetical protein